MGMEFDSRKPVSKEDEARISEEAKRLFAETEALREENAANTQRLQNIMADMVEGGEA